MRMNVDILHIMDFLTPSSLTTASFLSQVSTTFTLLFLPSVTCLSIMRERKKSNYAEVLHAGLSGVSALYAFKSATSQPSGITLLSECFLGDAASHLSDIFTQ